MDKERYELEQSREYKAAMELEKALNNTCFDYKRFAESVKYYHPTLQQNLFRLIREIIMYRQTRTDTMTRETRLHMRLQRNSRS